MKIKTIRFVYRGKYGIVSDFGEQIALREVDPNDLPLTDRQKEFGLFTIPRYGVWKHDVSKRKHQVVFTTDDLREAVRRADREERSA